MSYLSFSLCGIVSDMRLVPCFALISATLAASDAYPPPRFTDPDRVKKLESALPEIDRIFRAYAVDTRIPGMIWGVVIDDRLSHVESFGVRDLSSREKVSSDTAFRIASMTKSFTALAILKLPMKGNCRSKIRCPGGYPSSRGWNFRRATCRKSPSVS
jgi:CubicO group peptidase (beta-lactamase class C family)